MNRYTIYCSEGQTKKALKLGAPIHTAPYFSILIYETHNFFVKNDTCYYFPTAEEMMGWLRSQHKITTWHIDYYPSAKKYGYTIMGPSFVLEFENGDTYPSDLYDSYEKATLASIDAVLKYLTNLIL